MGYTPNDILKYILDNGKEAQFLQALMMHKNNFSLAEIGDGKFKLRDDKVKFLAPSYKINVNIDDDDIVTAVHNGLYVSAFISRRDDEYNVHFLVHQYPVSMKSQFEEQILDEVIRYMIMNTILLFRMDTPEKVEKYIKS